MKEKYNELNISCKVGVIYALYYKGKPFYIGQTKKGMYSRFMQHRRSAFNGTKKFVYNFIRSVTNYDSFLNEISIRPLQIVHISDLNRCEMKYIMYCIDRKNKLFNNCCKTNSYVMSKYGIDMIEYNLT